MLTSDERLLVKQRNDRQWLRKHVRAVSVSVVGLLALAGGAFVLAGPAFAEAMSDASATHVDVFWTADKSGNDVTTVDQVMSVERKITNGYWSMQVSFAPTTSARGNIAYMGLQTNSTRPDGSVGEMGIFSIWDADKSRNDVGTCVTFSGEGDGLSCRAAVPFSSSTDYRYRIKRLEADSDGQWWGAWIRDMSTGEEVHLGDLRNKNTFMTSSVVNFSEYWGASVPCSQLASSQVVWTQPAAKSISDADDTYTYHTTYSNMQHGDCTRASVNRVDLGWTKGVRVVAGADASVVTPPTATAATEVATTSVTAATRSTRPKRQPRVKSARTPAGPGSSVQRPAAASLVPLGDGPMAGHPLRPTTAAP
jgi:hypothetical protein